MKAKKFVIDMPNLMEEWDWEKNSEENIFPESTALGSSINKVWWICKQCGHAYQATPGHRSDKNRPTGCPKCAAKKRAKDRKDKLCEKENITLTYPWLLEEWDYEKNEVSPEQITKGSHIGIWWKCDKGHSWKTAVGNRIAGHGCPYCSGRFAIKGETDLLTVNPRLASEWNYEKNGGLEPGDVTANANRKVWWKCSVCGYEWEASIGNRNKKRNCPKCSEYRHVSVPEKVFFYYLSQIYDDIQENAKPECLGNMELDIYIPSLRVAIEYDGKVWHRNKERDIKKDRMCYKNGIRLLRIRELGLEKYETTAILFETSSPTTDLLYLESTVNNVIEYINKLSGVECNIDINLARDYYEILSSLNRNLKENSFGISHPELLNEWDYEKNAPLDPFNISSGSSRKVWWKCSKGHSWRTSVANRTNKSNLNKCPFCQVKRVTKGENDLISVGAPFLIDWDYEKNELSPDNYTLHSGKKVWWKCHVCGHSWEQTVDNRSKSGCKVCGRKRTAQLRSKAVKNIETNETYESAAAAERAYELYSGAVTRCCRNERCTAGGFHWCWVDKKE